MGQTPHFTTRTFCAACRAAFPALAAVLGLLLIPAVAALAATVVAQADAASGQDALFDSGACSGQRILDTVVDDEISLGDFVLAGGELAALCVIEAVVRLRPGGLGNDASSVEESFAEGLLEYPQYTKPLVWRGREVPEVLRSGHHAQIERWRRAQSLLRTSQRRPDLLAKRGGLSEEERTLLDGVGGLEPPSLSG